MLVLWDAFIAMDWLLSLFTHSLCFALTDLPPQTSPERLIPEANDPTLIRALINPGKRQDEPLEVLPPRLPPRRWSCFPETADGDFVSSVSHVTGEFLQMSEKYSSQLRERRKK